MDLQPFLPSAQSIYRAALLRVARKGTTHGRLPAGVPIRRTRFDFFHQG